jgi:transketolase
LFSLKPVDAEGIITNAGEAGNIILTVEDHYPEGGIHDLVAAAVTLKGIPVHGIFVTQIPGSASP